jgi:hypothetical protein
MWRQRITRLVSMLLVVQLLFSRVTLVRGFPYFGTSLVDNAPVWELPIAVWHLPAIQLLSVSGYCCGLRNQLVFEPRVRNGHVPMKPLGAVILAGSSIVWWGSIGLAAFAIWNRRRPTEVVVAEEMAGAEEEEKQS